MFIGEGADMLEFIGEVILEAVMEITKNKKISKWIRYPILLLIMMFYGFIVLGILSLGIQMFLDQKFLTAVLFIGIDVVLIGGLWFYYFKKNGGES